MGEKDQIISALLGQPELRRMHPSAHGGKSASCDFGACKWTLGAFLALQIRRRLPDADGVGARVRGAAALGLAERVPRLAGPRLLPRPGDGPAGLPGPAASRIPRVSHGPSRMSGRGVLEVLLGSRIEERCGSLFPMQGVNLEVLRIFHRNTQRLDCETPNLPISGCSRVSVGGCAKCATQLWSQFCVARDVTPVFLVPMNWTSPGPHVCLRQVRLPARLPDASPRRRRLQLARVGVARLRRAARAARLRRRRAAVPAGARRPRRPRVRPHAPQQRGAQITQVSVRQSVEGHW